MFRWGNTPWGPNSFAEGEESEYSSYDVTDSDDDTTITHACYEVIPLNEILARKFVVAVPNEPGVFHVSSFMPNWC